jgi:ribosome modulation factor
VNQRKAYQHGYNFGLYGVADKGCFLPEQEKRNQWIAWNTGVVNGMRARTFSIELRDPNCPTHGRKDGK